MTIEFPPRPTARYELIWLLDKHWRSLDALVAGLREAELVVPLIDWSVKDHLAHVAAWQGKALAALQGIAPHDGLGLDASQYETLDLEGMNDVLYESWKDVPLVEVVGSLHHGYASVTRLLNKTPWPELEAISWPNEDPDQRTVLDVVISNTYEHYIEHETWIREQLASRGG